jgi:hypothetical protein
MTNSGKPSSTEKFSKKKIVNLRTVSKKPK